MYHLSAQANVNDYYGKINGIFWYAQYSYLRVFLGCWMLHFETEEIGPLTTMNILTLICFYYYVFQVLEFILTITHTHSHTHTLSNYHTRKDQSLTANKTHIQSLRSFSWNRKLHMFLKFHIKPLHSPSCRGEGSQACLWAWGRKDLKPRWFLSYHHISCAQSPLNKHPHFTAFLAGLAYQAAFALSN